MNLVLREIRACWKSFLLWCLGVGFFMAVIAMKLSGTTGANGAAEFEQIFSQMPRVFQNMFGVGILDFSKAADIFAMISTYLALILAFHAAGIGSTSFAKEERDRTFEFLYVKGMPRYVILSVKWCISIFQIILLNIFTSAIGIFTVHSVLGQDMGPEFTAIMRGIFLLQLTFFSIAFFLSLLTHQQKRGSTISFAIVMVCFVFAMLSDFSDELEFLKYFTPFKYFDGKGILLHGLNPLYCVICLLIILGCTITSFLLHQRRDLHT